MFAIERLIRVTVASTYPATTVPTSVMSTKYGDWTESRGLVGTAYDSVKPTRANPSYLSKPSGGIPSLMRFIRILCHLDFICVQAQSDTKVPANTRLTQDVDIYLN